MKKNSKIFILLICMLLTVILIGCYLIFIYDHDGIHSAKRLKKALIEKRSYYPKNFESESENVVEGPSDSFYSFRQFNSATVNTDLMMMTNADIKGNERFLICFPGGGLNDILNILNGCRLVCLLKNCKVVFVTKYSWMREDIERYMTFNRSMINYLYDPNVDGGPVKMYNGSSEIKSYMQAKNILSIDKIEVGGNVYYGRTKAMNNVNMQKLSSQYSVTPFSNYDDRKNYSYVKDKNLSNSPSTTTTTQKNVEIVYYFSLGGGQPVEFLSFCQLTPLVLDRFHMRLKQLPENYVAIHIRNTDFTSRVGKFLSNIDAKLFKKPIFVASDSASTIDLVKSIYGSKNVYSFANITDIRDTGMINIHRDLSQRRSQKEQDDYVIDTFVDLLLLVHAKEYYFSFPYSGYSNLAKVLREHPDILNHLINQQESRQQQQQRSTEEKNLIEKLKRKGKGKRRRQESQDSV